MITLQGSRRDDNLRNIIKEVEAKQHANDHDSGGVRAFHVVDCRAGGPNDIGSKHSSARDEEERPTSEPIDHERCTKRSDEIENLSVVTLARAIQQRCHQDSQAAIDERLVERIGDTDGVEHEL